MIRQLFVNDALVMPGTFYFREISRFGGGPLGEPNFESLAIACIGGMSFLQIARAIRQIDLPSTGILRIGFETMMMGIGVWGFFLGINFLGERHGIFSQDVYIISTAIFNAHFTNPHRIFIVPPIAALYVVAVLMAVRRCFSYGSNRETSA
ncbi:MAG: hypothetical protein KF749_09685 [Bacteroidetes bacterium]|nr:hypothetical protein [Bacteroidota bacterium]MCW5895018.1 hypothetical protein [Bacteroidota bacterium]